MWAKPKYASAKSNSMQELWYWSKSAHEAEDIHDLGKQELLCIMWWDAVESEDSSGEAVRVYDMQNAVPEQRGWTVTVINEGFRWLQHSAIKKKIAMAFNDIAKKRTTIPLFPVRNTNLQEKIKSLKEEGRSTTPNPPKTPTFTMGPPTILPNTWPRRALGCHQSGAGCCRHQ